jgi:uncharacterized damage-inducible protein DinB
MTMLEHINRLFSYDDWANREVLSAVRVAGSPARPLQLMSHIFSAERLWMERMKGQQQTFPVWPGFTLEQCVQQAADLAQLWKHFLSPANQPDLAAPVSYKNTEGQPFVSQKQDILMHVLMHSVYHRGQIATDMRAAGFTPAHTDFILAARQRLID